MSKSDIQKIPEDNLAASMIEQGQNTFRTSGNGEKRGVFCGMGICGECSVHIKGHGVVRACMTTDALDGEVRSHDLNHLPDAQVSQIDRLDINRMPDVLIVGAGPAGLATAQICANNGLEVIVLDDREKPGGQFFKQPTAAFYQRQKRKEDWQAKAGFISIQETQKAGAVIISKATVWAIEPDLKCHVVVDNISYDLKPKKLVLATGAFEKPFPFPGWTTPGVMTTGAVQTLLRSYGVCPGDRIAVAGNGPLNIQVAAEIIKSGGSVVTVVEAAPLFSFPRLIRLMLAALNTPIPIIRGIGYLITLKRAGVPIISSAAISKVVKVEKGLQIDISQIKETVQSKKKIHTIEADTLSLGQGFLPAVELSRMVGCEHEVTHEGMLKIVRSESFETSVNGLYQVGDSGGLEGAPAAIAQGEITGCAITEELTNHVNNAQRNVSTRNLKKHRKFQKNLWKAYDAPTLSTQFADDETIICRCENVKLSDITTLLKSGETPPNIKRATRCGMGACQGRYCSWLMQQIFHQHGKKSNENKTYWAPRPPARPVAMHALATGDYKEPEVK